MKIGNKDLKCCNDCPAYRWAGESVSRGNCGCYCDFGVFHSDYSERTYINAEDEYTGGKQIPPTCPFRQFREEIRCLQAKLGQNVR